MKTMKERLLEYIRQNIDMNQVSMTINAMNLMRIPLYRMNPELCERINDLVIDFSMEMGDMNIYREFDDYDEIIYKL